MEEPCFLLDIERQIFQDHDGSVRRSLRERLNNMRRALEQQLRSPGALDTGRRVRACLHAVEAASGLLARYGG